MTPISIRQAQSADLESLVPLFDGYRRFYRKPSEPDRVRAFLRDRLRNGDSVVFLAALALGEPPVGFTQLYPVFSSVTIGRALILNDLFVLPSARGHGVGQALLEHAARYAGLIGAIYLELETEVTNVTAQRLYEKLGWVRETAFHKYSLAVAPP